jgi:hypothetical protein
MPRHNEFPRAGRLTSAAASLLALLLLSGCVEPMARGANPIVQHRDAGFTITQVTLTNETAFPGIGAQLKGAIEQTVVPAFNGTRPIQLVVFIDHFQMIGGGELMLVGSADVLAVTATVIDGSTGATLAEYPINQARAAAGLLGLMIRGGDDDAKKKLVENYATLLIEEIKR